MEAGEEAGEEAKWYCETVEGDGDGVGMISINQSQIRNMLTSDGDLEDVLHKRSNQRKQILGTKQGYLLL